MLLFSSGWRLLELVFRPLVAVILVDEAEPETDVEPPPGDDDDDEELLLLLLFRVGELILLPPFDFCCCCCCCFLLVTWCAPLGSFSLVDCDEPRLVVVGLIVINLPLQLFSFVLFCCPPLVSAMFWEFLPFLFDDEDEGDELDPPLRHTGDDEESSFSLLLFFTTTAKSIEFSRLRLFADVSFFSFFSILKFEK